MNDDEKGIMQTLHTQFAENQNHWQSNFIKLFAALLTIFGGLGYVYAHWECNSVNENSSSTFLFSTDTLIFAIFIANILLSLIIMLVIHFGWSYRRDQILNDKIRRFLFTRTMYDHLFKNYGTKTTSLPDFYEIFRYFGIFFQIILFLFSVFIYLKICCLECQNITCHCLLNIVFVINFFVVLLTIFIEIFYDYVKRSQIQNKK